ncbi:MAG: (Na+)-NQR maturation NqrM [Gammaproteobacteria bacterium]|jgi:hypothetical protein|nr:(Na+)-NQR maturation NqrM [Gammaproteobacteria bacterium]MDA7785112.1 (Na+)-NQR maturation NqrM [Pseudomonadales bacterium]MBT3695491.1 (Na+)-NQR maturation NqrM [Gammaproteobacteria bacterium]MBT5332445.1 (Na+)-NQR maturation NqrM [Gammaproteobacteria bacterium]MBT5681329.1 (Na+)-NQR maturation NqrM [Gammaproteobacteria bacterium]
MTTVIFAFVAMLTLTAAMAVGVIFGRKPIAGTCGGMKALGMEMDCEICGGDQEVCDSVEGNAPTKTSVDAESLTQRIGN